VEPAKVSIPTQMLTTEETGENRTTVWQEVEQVTTGRRKGREMLILVAPGRKLTDEGKERIKNLLRNYQVRLAELVTQKIDWNKASGLVVQHSDLDTWMDELQPQICPILSKSLTPSKHSNLLNWIMRPKVLCLAIALLIALCFLVKGQIFPRIVDGGNQRVNINPRNPVRDILGREAQQPRMDAHRDWMAALDIQPPSDIQPPLDITPTEANALILQKLNTTLFAVGKDFNDLRECLRVLNECLGRPCKDREPSLEQLLSNVELRSLIQRVIRNPTSTLHPNHINDPVEQTLSRLFSDRSPPDVIRKRFESLRQLLVAASEISKSGEKFAGREETENWLRFAGEQPFYKGGEDKSTGYKENVADREPQFITVADIELSKYMYEWLNGRGAVPLLQNRSGYGNFEEVLRSVVLGGDARARSPFRNFQTNDEKDLFISSNISEERETQERELLESFLRFRKHAVEVVNQLPVSNR